ncbi:uncharacterized protein LOC125546634 [Triticum urartu]|uniref:uncharacterized protein LOC125546634 n=1 Tax=Triticum urartu TaxID=4572 RepID=UPI0020437FA5|nr:uncharacterized protein LOC125546634 [Triticum urartu]
MDATGHLSLNTILCAIGATGHLVEHIKDEPVRPTSGRGHVSFYSRALASSRRLLLFLFLSLGIAPPPPSSFDGAWSRSGSGRRLVQIGLRSSPLRAGVNSGKRWGEASDSRQGEVESHDGVDSGKRWGEASGSRQGEPRQWPASAATSSPRRCREAAEPAPELPIRERSLCPPAVPRPCASSRDVDATELVKFPPYLPMLPPTLPATCVLTFVHQFVCRYGSVMFLTPIELLPRACVFCVPVYQLVIMSV